MSFISILTPELLETEKRKEQMAKSIDGLKNVTGEDTDSSKAQEMIFKYISYLGGVREDVYEFLLHTQWRDISTVTAIRPLLYYAAPVEWLVLADRMQERKESFFVNEVVTTFKEDIPIEAANKMFDDSFTLFELAQNRVKYLEQKKRDEKNEIIGNIADFQTKISLMEKMLNRLLNERIYYRDKLPDTMSRREAEEVLDTMSRGEEGKVPDTMSRREEEVLDTMPRGEEGKVPDTMSRREEGKVPDKVSRREEEEVPDIMSRREEEKVPDIMSQSENDIPDFPKGEEVLEQKTAISITDLKEKEKQAGKRISFFVELLKWHQKKHFMKLSDKEQLSKLFELMIGKKYNKNKIRLIKSLLDHGMSHEFVYSMVEKDLPEEELKEVYEGLFEKDTADIEQEEPDTMYRNADNRVFENEEFYIPDEEYEDEFEGM